MKLYTDCTECKVKDKKIKQQQKEIEVALYKIQRGLTMDGVNILRRLLPL